MTLRDYHSGPYAAPDAAAALHPEALEAARRAARRAGVPLQQWLESAIREGAADAAGPADSARRYAPPRHPGGADPAIGAALDDISTRLHSLLSDVSAQQATPEPAANLRTVISRLGARIDGLIEQSRGAPPQRHAGDLDGAMAEISARQRALDIEPHMHATSNRTPESERRAAIRPTPPDDGIAHLRREVGELSRALAGYAPRRSVDNLETSMRALQARVESQKMPAIDLSALSDMTRMLADIRETIRASRPSEAIAALGEDLRGIDRKLDRLADTTVDVGALQHLTDQIVELRTGMSRMAASDSNVQLAVDLRDLAAKIDRIVDQTSDGAAALEVMAAIERRVEILGDAIAANSHHGAMPDVADLRDRLDRIQSILERQTPGSPPATERAIAAIVEKLDRLSGLIGAAPDMSGFHSRLDVIAERLDESETQLDQLRAIERGINDLFAQIAETRATTLETTRQSDPAPLPLMNDLMRDLSELREAQRETEGRTRKTLEAVHGTLERVVDRLASLESEPARKATPRAPSPMQATREQPVVATPVVATPVMATPVAASEPVIAAQPASVELPIEPKQRPVMPSPVVAPPASGVDGLPPDHPLEPGSYHPGRTTSPIIDPLPADGAPFAGSRAGEPNARESFIAAARRAAQQANLESSAEPAKAASANGTSALATIGQALAARKTLLLAGLALLITVLALPKIVDIILPMVQPQPPAVVAPVPLPDEPAGGQGNTAPPSSGDVSAPGKQSSNAADRATASAPPAGIIATAPAGAAPTLASGSFVQNAPEQTGSIPPAAGQEGLPAAIGPLALRNAAASGDPAAMYEVASRFAEGRGVTANPAEAVRWFQRAATLGLAPAAYRLGSLYEKGQGVTRDTQVARRLYSQAADAGNAKAMHNLAVLIAEGVDGKPDYKSALKLFRKAAERGVRDSQYNLGVLYARGLGVDQNFAESYKWFALAATQGDADATKKREDVASRLDAQALLAARLAAQSFAVESTDNSANTVRLAPDWTRAETSPPKKAPART